MKLLEIFRFEFGYQVRRIPTWLFFAVVFVVAYTNLRENWLADALYDDFFVNSPFIIASTSVFCCLVWVLAAGAVAGEATARDMQTRMHPLTYTTPVSKFEYLGGRFLAAFALNAMIMLAVPLGIMVAIYGPGVDPEVIGPFRAGAYLRAFFYISLPTVFLGTTVQFAMAALNRRAMSAYFGSLLIFGQAYIVTIAIGYLLGRPDIARLLDPIGVVAIIGDIATSWTPGEKSTRMITLEGTLLWNRIIWLSVGVLVLIFTYLRFRLEHPVPVSLWRRITQRRPVAPKTDVIHIGAETEKATITIPEIARVFGFTIYMRQAFAIAMPCFWMLIKRRGGIIILFVTSVVLLVFMRENLYNMDVPQLPRTEYILSFITSPLGNLTTALIVIPLILVIYAGELVWRERDSGVSEMIDAAPVPEWTLFIGKFGALALFLIVWMGSLVGVALLIQLIMGYDGFQIELLVKVLFGLQLPEYLLFAIVTLLIHTVVNQKYIGHLASFFFYAMILFASFLGFEHHLLIFASSPGWYYTDMRGFGGSLGPWMWFKLYWSAWALLLVVIMKLFWVRGKDPDLRMRLQLARLRFTKPTAFVSIVAIVVILGAGGFIFYNTNVLNEYRTSSSATNRNAEYERKYGQYKNLAQPTIAGVKLHVELYPGRGAMDIRGTYDLVNKTGAPIDSIHLATVHGLETNAVTFNRTARVLHTDDDLHHHIYSLEKALQPGDSLQLTFEVHLNPQGFRNGGINRSVVANGTYFTEGDERWMPLIGYQSDRELIKPTDRRKYRLPQRRMLPSLYEVDAMPRETVDNISFEAVIGTDDDQVAVTTGELRRTWSEKGRRYFHYVASAPIGGSYSVLSARYKLHEETWTPSDSSQESVAIKVFYHPDHAAILDHIVPAVKASLSYHTKRFSAYPFTHITIAERGGLGRELSAESAFIDYSEGFTRFNREQGEESADIPFAVTAHEMGHQWWGGQIHYAMAEGAGLLSESLAWYTAMGVVEDTYGREHMERLRGFFRQPYPIPPIRQSVPLLRAADPYASYRKGPFAMYAMSQYVGKDTIDRALQTLIRKHNSGTATTVTTLDLYRELKAVTPDSLQYLLHDLFEANTFWDLDTKKVIAKQIDNNTWQVDLEVDVKKVVVDSTGIETAVPMNDWIDVGVYTAREQGQELRKPLYLQKHLFHSSGKQTITITVKDKPDGAGIDPGYLLIDTEPHDNARKVKIVE